MALLARAGMLVSAIVILIVPAIWNGFPLVEYDTGGYIARWYEGTLTESRSTVYGLFLNVLSWGDFWPAIIVQSALTVWIFSVVLRVYGFGAKVMLASVAVLSVLTTLPWLTSVLLTDIFAGLAVLALHVVVLHGGALRRIERMLLIVFIGFAAATHSGTFAVLLVLLAAAFLVALFARGRVPMAGLRRGAFAIVLSVVMLLAGNFVVARSLAWTPGGPALLFGRMLQDGIVTRFLDDHCPDARFKLCPYRHQFPKTADEFFWVGGSIFQRLGGFTGLHDEMDTITIESLRDYPWLNLKAAVMATITQLEEIGTGYGVGNDVWHTYGIFKTYLPDEYRDMNQARQQKGEMNFDAINRLHVPVGWASMILLIGAAGLGLARRGYGDIGALAASSALAILANAAVFGVLSGPHDRYGARMVWIATFVVLLVPVRALLKARLRSTAKLESEAEAEEFTPGPQPAATAPLPTARVHGA